MSDSTQRTIENDFRCEAHEDRARLDRILADRYPRFNRGEWQDRIRAGDVLVNDALARPSRKVATGDTIRFRFQRGPEPEVSRDYRIVYEDDALYIVDKPGDLPVHPSGVYNENTLYALIKAERGADFPVNLVHRLDRETSGLMVIAKDSNAARKLQAAFQARSGSPDEVRKIYHTIVECPTKSFPETLDARGWIFAAGAGPVKKKRSFACEKPASSAPAPTSRNENDHDEASSIQSARTQFRLLDSREAPPRSGSSQEQEPEQPRDPGALTKSPHNARIALVEARLFTGRMHQIRATLCSLGWPVVGDRLYGVDERLYLRMIQDLEDEADRARLRINRTALHATRLEFRHPESGKALRFESELPADMRGLFLE